MHPDQDLSCRVIAIWVHDDVQQSEVTRDQSLLPIAYDDARGAVGVVYETLRGVERTTVDHIGNLIQRMHAIGLNALYGLESFRAGDIPHVPHFGSVIECRAQHIVEHVLRNGRWVTTAGSPAVLVASSTLVVIPLVLSARRSNAVRSMMRAISACSSDMMALMTASEPPCVKSCSVTKVCALARCGVKVTVAIVAALLSLSVPSAFMATVPAVNFGSWMVEPPLCMRRTPRASNSGRWRLLSCTGPTAVGTKVLPSPVVWKLPAVPVLVIAVGT